MVASVAASMAVSTCIVIEDFPHKSQHATHNVADDDFARLCCCESAADLADALHKLCGIAPFELTHNAEHKSGRS